MPLYMVRSPHLTISIISAADEDDLRLQLDEVADPALFTWQEYQGPLWVDFEPPIRFVAKFRDDNRPMASDEFELDGVKELAREGWMLRGSPGESAAGARLAETLTSYAFPAVAALEPIDDDMALDARELEGALKDDLVRHAWVLAQKLKKEPPTEPPTLDQLQDLWRRLGIEAPDIWLIRDGGDGQGNGGDEPVRALLAPRLADSDYVMPAWSVHCHWCGRREYVDGELPETPTGWIQHYTRNEGVFLFCSHRCEHEADQHSSILRIADCDHTQVSADNVCELCGLALDD